MSRWSNEKTREQLQGHNSDDDIEEKSVLMINKRIRQSLHRCSDHWRTHYLFHCMWDSDSSTERIYIYNDYSKSGKGRPKYISYFIFY